MMSSLLGSASSHSSTESVTTRVSVFAVSVTLSKVRSDVAVMALPSDFQPGVPSPVSRASFSVWLVIGTVWPPACSTRVWLRARSITRLLSGVGTRWPPAVRVPSDRARSCWAPDQSPVASPFR